MIQEQVRGYQRQLEEEINQEADHLRHTEKNRQIYAQRKETIERVFADLKEKHGLRWTTLRGLKKVTMQAMLVYAAMNLKKLANWLWRSGQPWDSNRWFRYISILLYEKLPRRSLRWVARGSLSSVCQPGFAGLFFSY